MTEDQFLVAAYLEALEARAASDLRVLMELQRLHEEDDRSAPLMTAQRKPRWKTVITHGAYKQKIRVLAATRIRAS